MLAGPWRGQNRRMRSMPRNRRGRLPLRRCAPGRRNQGRGRQSVYTLFVSHLLDSLVHCCQDRKPQRCQDRQRQESKRRAAKALGVDSGTRHVRKHESWRHAGLRASGATWEGDCGVATAISASLAAGRIAKGANASRPYDAVVRADGIPASRRSGQGPRRRSTQKPRRKRPCPPCAAVYGAYRRRAAVLPETSHRHTAPLDVRTQGSGRSGLGRRGSGRVKATKRGSLNAVRSYTPDLISVPQVELSGRRE